MSNAAVDPAQLPVEVAIDAPVTLPALIALAGFEQLVPIFQALALCILNFKLGGRTLTNAEHTALLQVVNDMKQTVNQMHH